MEKIKDVLNAIFKRKYKPDADFGEKFLALLWFIIASYFLSGILLIFSLVIIESIIGRTIDPYVVSLFLLLFYFIIWLALLFLKIKNLKKPWPLKRLYIFQVCLITVYFNVVQDELIIGLGNQFIENFSYYYKDVQSEDYTEKLFINGKKSLSFQIIQFINDYFSLVLLGFILITYLFIDSKKNLINFVIKTIREAQ